MKKSFRVCRKLRTEERVKKRSNANMLVEFYFKPNKSNVGKFLKTTRQRRIQTVIK